MKLLADALKALRAVVAVPKAFAKLRSDFIAFEASKPSFWLISLAIMPHSLSDTSYRKGWVASLCLQTFPRLLWLFLENDMEYT